MDMNMVLEIHIFMTGMIRMVHQGEEDHLNREKRMIDIAVIKNSELVTRHFGQWPSFHDAEVLRIELDRDTLTVSITVFAFEMLKEIDERGYYKQIKHCLITFVLQRIQELELHDFNEQNALFEIDFQQTSDGIVVTLFPTYGVRGRMISGEIEVLSLKPLTGRVQRRQKPPISGTEIKGHKT